MTEEDDNRARSVIGLIGPPRSGTTLIANCVMAHSAIAGIVEPYQLRRTEKYETTSHADLMRDFKVGSPDKRHLLVKETTTRTENADSLLKLLSNARRDDIYTGLIIVLRCPYAAYLSQVEASSKFWNEKKMTEVSDESFILFARTTKEGLSRICAKARMQHYRIVSYEGFCRNPRLELARLMALIALPLEPKRQLSFAPPNDVTRGGDPKTVMKAGNISPTQRGDEVKAAMGRFSKIQLSGYMRGLRQVVLDSACREPDHVTLDRLALLTI